MTVSQQAIDAAAEAIEDAAMRWIGRDLGTLHRNEIVEAGLNAAEPFMVAGCYICQPENPNAAEEGCDHCDAEASMYRHAEVLRVQLAALTAQLQTVRDIVRESHIRVGVTDMTAPLLALLTPTDKDGGK